MRTRCTVLSWLGIILLLWVNILYTKYSESLVPRRLYNLCVTKHLYECGSEKERLKRAVVLVINNVQ